MRPALLPLLLGGQAGRAFPTVLTTDPAVALSPDVWVTSPSTPRGLTLERWTDPYDMAMGVPPDSVVTKAWNRRGMMELDGLGSGAVTTSLHHPSGIELGDVCRFSINGRAIHTWIVTSQKQATARPDPAAETVEHSGPGVAGLLAEAVVYPPTPLGSLPIVRDRVFGWQSIEFYDWNPRWQSAVRVCSVATAQTVWPILPFWSDLDPSIGATVDVIGPAQAGVAYPGRSWDAPGGDWYSRQTIEIPSHGSYGLFFVADNEGEIWVDGVEFVSTSAWDRPAFAAIEFSDDYHLIATHCTNYGTVPGSGPTGVAWAIFHLDTLGQPVGAPVAVSNASEATATPMLDSPPGMTFGAVAHQLLNEWQAKGLADGWQFDFTDSTDSTGVAFERREWSTKVGTDGAKFLFGECSTFLHLRTVPGALILQAAADFTTWGEPSLALPSNIEDPRSGNLTELSHDAEIGPGNCALVLSPAGWSEVDRSHGAGRKRSFLLSLGTPTTAEVANDTAWRELSRLGVPQVVITAGVDLDYDRLPPYYWRLGEMGELPNRHLSGEDIEMMMSWSFTEADTGRIMWTPELRAKALSTAQRHEQAIKSMSDGTARGRSTIASPAAQVSTSTSRQCCAPAPPTGLTWASAARDCNAGMRQTTLPWVAPATDTITSLSIDTFSSIETFGVGGGTIAVVVNGVERFSKSGNSPQGPLPGGTWATSIPLSAGDRVSLRRESGGAGGAAFAWTAKITLASGASGGLGGRGPDSYCST